MRTPFDYSDTSNELGAEYIGRYSALRVAKKIGILWPSAGLFFLAPLPAGNQSDAEFISLQDLRREIDYWYPRVLPVEVPVQRRGPDRALLPLRGKSRLHIA